ncbi:uncharacterized protein LOC107036656 [Diachasma alloeum]|uniref:uncharacterized protein LOC107036656 n=1 Tax=Diachasma alloeum TaxID=454923 RepID=UPI0007381AB4|nr:uncharacterized protein LOC107036656 [Diachasma alloeum]
MADMSLDDIIKKKKPQGKMGLKGRGGIRKAPARTNVRPTQPPRRTKPITDARFKIIQKNREKLTDARDKLAQIAKQSDARLKLEKLRATHKPPSLATISRKTGRNGKISLSTNRIPPLVPSYDSQLPYNVPPRIVGYRGSLGEPSYMENMSMDYQDDSYMVEAPLRRTVSNEYAPGPPPPPPVFGIKPSAGYSWPKSAQRPTIIRKTEVERPREYKIIPRIPMGQKIDSYRDDWGFGGKTRTILADEHEEKYFDVRSHRDVGVKSRLEGSGTKPRALGVLGRAKSSSSGGSSQPTGYRIVVSNLQANVTQEDIKELFEDVGELLVSRLVRPGTAEVIYKTLKDATKAVETYHNRQLDGHPMKCLLVNPRPKNNPTAPAVRPLTESRRTASSSYVQPSLGAVHRALFDDCHN